MVENWNKKFAFYAVSLYRVGNYTDSALVGSIMFEKAVYSLLKAKQISRNDVKRSLPIRTGELQHAINLMCEKYSQYNWDILDGIRRNIRNEITHEIDINEIDRDKIQPMILFIWEALEPLSYQAYNGIIDNIDFLTADYTVVDIREIFNENLQDILAKDYQFNTFELEDFHDLFKLRNKMISLGSKIKREMLKIDYKNELFIDIISKVDTTSAYVWMCIHLYDIKRKRIDSASASILGTPLDLRIYFDIGGGAYQVRQDYYKFLRSDYFANFQDNCDLNGIELFDNDWYSFIVNRVSLSELSTEDMNRKILEAEEKLAEYDEHSKITWNRMLCGYIIKRGEISFEEIKKKLEDIIKLYYCFEDFRQHELKRNKIQFKYHIHNFCTKKSYTRPTPYSTKHLNFQGLK